MDHQHQGFLNRGQSVGIGHSQVSPRSQYCDSDEINSDGGERSTRGGEGVVETEKRPPASCNFCRRFPVEVTQTPCMTHDAGGVHRRNRMLALGRDTAARSHTIRLDHLVRADSDDQCPRSLVAEQPAGSYAPDERGHTVTATRMTLIRHCSCAAARECADGSGVRYGRVAAPGRLPAPSGVGKRTVAP